MKRQQLKRENSETKIASNNHHKFSSLSSLMLMLILCRGGCRLPEHLLILMAVSRCKLTKKNTHTEAFPLCLPHVEVMLQF